MLVAFCGPQGSGKTTIIDHTRSKHQVIERKTARSILSDWGVTLHDVNNDFKLSVKFQEEVIKRKSQDEAEAVADKSKIWFVDRTFADVFIYTLINFGKNNEYSDWLNSYYEQCKELQQRYDAVLYVPGGFFPIKEDGVRGHNQHYGRMVDLLMSDYCQRMTPNDKIWRIYSADISDRHSVVDSIVKTLSEKNA